MKDFYMNIKRSLLVLSILLFCAGVYFISVNYMDILKKFENEIAIIIDKKSQHPNKFSVILSKKEKEFLINNLKIANHYLEFGSGGSTFLALLNSDADIISVENDKKWIKHLEEWSIIRENCNKKRLQLYYVNTGEIGGYGWPKNLTIDKPKFPNYSENVFKNFSNNYDLVFIDGRFRVACALQTILNTDADVKIIIHDFTNRPHYHDILDFLTIEQTIDTMVLLKKKQNIDRNKVINMYENYKYDCR